MAYLCFIHFCIKPKTIRNLAIRGITQNRMAATDKHWSVRGGDTEMSKNAFDVGIAFQVDVRVWVSIARQEFFDAQCVGGMTGADQRGVSETLCQQLNAPRNERTHHDVAQLCIRLY